jgi:hypothetical protein
MGKSPDTPLDDDTARELAQRENAKAFITGEIGSVGSGYVLSTRIVATNDGRELVALRETAAIENCLLSVNDLEAPVNLRYAVLAAVKDRRAKGAVIPALRFAFKAAGVFALAVSGVWLGLQTANGGNAPVVDGFDISQSPPYSLNTEPVYPGSLAEIYFSLIEEGTNAK